MSTVIHELQQVMWVSTDLGDGIVILVIDYGPQENCVFLVLLEDGRYKHFNTEQVRACRNDTFGISVKKRVVATRDIGILCLIGKKGTVVEELPSQYSVEFDGESKPVLVNKSSVELIK